jgi:hypothetical protein
MKKYIVFSTLFLMVGLVAVPAHATLLSAPGSVSPSAITETGSAVASFTDTTLHNSPEYSGGCSTDPVLSNPVLSGTTTGMGTLVADTCVLQKNAYFHGSYLTLDFREVVYKEAGGTLDFYLQAAVVGTPVSGTTLSDMFQLPFSGVTMNVGTATGVGLLNMAPQSTSGTNDDPTTVVAGAGGAPRPQCTSAGNSCISWLFNGLGLNGVALTMEIQTNATSFITGGVGFDVNSNIGMDPVLAFAPVAPVPEPVSIILMGTVLALGAFFIRRRRTAKNDLSVS